MYKNRYWCCILLKRFIIAHITHLEFLFSMRSLEVAITREANTHLMQRSCASTVMISFVSNIWRLLSSTICSLLLQLYDTVNQWSILLSFCNTFCETSSLAHHVCLKVWTNISTTVRSISCNLIVEVLHVIIVVKSRCSRLHLLVDIVLLFLTWSLINWWLRNRWNSSVDHCFLNHGWLISFYVIVP